MLDRVAASVAAVVAPPLAGTALVGRFASIGGKPDLPNEAGLDWGRAASVGSLAEDRVRTVARLARAPRRIGLPPLPGWRDTCLTRSFAAAMALRARGFPATIAFGVRAGDAAGADVAAHAWVVLGGRPLLDQSAGQYVEFSQEQAHHLVLR